MNLKNKLQTLINKTNRFSLLYLITCLLLLILPYYLFAGKLYVGGDDTRLFYAYPFDFLKNYTFFTWINNSSIGINSANQHLLPFLSIWSVLDLLINNKVIISYLAFSLPLILGFIYFNKFVIELFSLKNSHKLEVYLGSLFFLLSPIIIINQMFIFLTTIWLLGVIPAIGYYYIRYIKYSNFVDVYKSLIISIIFAFLILSIPWILGLILPMLAGLTVLIFLSRREEILFVLKRSVVFFSILVSCQAFWLIGFLAPFILRDTNSYAIKFISKDYLDTFTPVVLSTANGFIIYPLLDLFHRQIAFDFSWKLMNDFINLYDKTFFLNLLFVSILGIGIFNYKKYLRKTSRRIYLFILTSFIAALYLFTVNIGPLKDLFLLFGKLPGFLMFRNFYDKFAISYIFLYSILIVISLILIRKRYPGKKYLISILIILVILVNFSPVKSTVNSPIWTTENIYKTINMPKEYLNLMSSIEKDIPNSNNILSIPFGIASYTVIKDENSNNAFVGTSPVKIFSGVNDISGNFSFSFSKEQYLLEQEISSRNYKDINKLLYKYNINYVLVTKNVPEEVLRSYVFNPSAIGKQDLEFLRAITDKKILTSDNGNYDLYTTKNRNILFQSPNLIFQKINSVKFKLYIKNLKNPQELIFNDTFNADWKFYLQKKPNSSFCDMGGSLKLNNSVQCKSKFSFFSFDELSYLWNNSIFDKSHTVLNEFSNKWVIDPGYVKKFYNSDYYTVNKDGSVNIELILYFKEQLYFYYGLAITFIVFSLSSAYLIYTLYKRNEKRN
jgi:hypothetical protein